MISHAVAARILSCLSCLFISGSFPLTCERYQYGELCLVLTRTGSHDALFGRGGKNF